MSGPIRLKNPEMELMLLEFYGVDPTEFPLRLYDVFLGRLVSYLKLLYFHILLTCYCLIDFRFLKVKDN